MDFLKIKSCTFFGRFQTWKASHLFLRGVVGASVVVNGGVSTTFIKAELPDICKTTFRSGTITGSSSGKTTGTTTSGGDGAGVVVIGASVVVT